jgi:aspartate kinase
MESHVATDIMLYRDITRMRVVLRDERCDYTRLIEVLDRHDICAEVVDLARDTTHPASIVLTLLLRGSDMPRARLLVFECLDGARDYEIACDENLAMVSILGFGISSDLTAVARIIELLDRSRIGVHELFTSDNRINCFVDPDSAELAASVLNHELGGHKQAT